MPKATPAAIVHIKRSESFIVPALPAGVDFPSLVGTMEVELARDHELANIEPNSLFWGFVHAAELGLRVGKVHEEAYILGFKNRQGVKVGQIVLGYKGLIKLAYRHPMIQLVDAHVVRENDFFDYDLGSANTVSFKPEIRKARGRPLCAFCKILVGGSTTKAQWKVRIVTYEEIEQAKSCSPRSRAADSPWNRTPEAMWKKTSIRRAMGDVPRSPDYMRAESIEEAYDRGEVADVVQVVRDVQPPIGTSEVRERQTDVIDGEVEEPAF